MIDITKFIENLPSWLQSKNGRSITYQERDTLKEVLDYAVVHPQSINNNQKRIIELSTYRMTCDLDPEIAITDALGEIEFVRILDMSEDGFLKYKESGFEQFNPTKIPIHRTTKVDGDIHPEILREIERIEPITDEMRLAASDTEQSNNIDAINSQNFLGISDYVRHRMFKELKPREQMVWMELCRYGFPINKPADFHNRKEGKPYSARMGVDTLTVNTGIVQKNIYRVIRSLEQKSWIAKIGKCEWKILVPSYANS